MNVPRVVCFGECLVRLGAPQYQRLVGASSFDVAYTGAEANVAVSLANFGYQAYIVSVVPENEIGDACINFFRQFGVDTGYVQRTSDRLGVFYLEAGASQRSSKVIYDRAHSGFSRCRPDTFDWREIFEGKDWLHLSGTAPAVSETAAATVQAACAAAKQAGLRISIDMNFRNKLWQWKTGKTARELARETMRELLPYMDVIVGNEEDAFDVLGIRAGETEVEKGTLDIERYPDVARQIADAFPQASHIALTLRESLSASHNRWGAMLYAAANRRALFAPAQDGVYRPYDIIPIVDRVGGGDSFSAGLIYGLTAGMEDAEALDFAVAASCLKHSVPGDVNQVKVEEVMTLVRGITGGRIKR